MKRIVLFVSLLLILSVKCYTQITGPVIRANFGVDADLRANFFNAAVQSGNDDWFNLPGSSGTGQFVIDTTGAAARVARYAVDLPYRRSTFVSPMRYPVYSVINNSLLLDAAFVRDFHGDDSTVFASGSSKNGDNPRDWNTPVSQGIPDKNDILDMMVHIRRAGPGVTDSLWMMGGMSLDNTTGDRYFDFEMYQTDLVYDRSTLSFSGYGPDDGHTSWEFDPSGKILKAGDIIFSAEYQSSALTLVEARIWINKASLALSPSAFAWGGKFDGASSGSTFGYASIQPTGAGAYYTGLASADNTWGGPFSIILQNDAIATNYSANQYVEFSVNLTKLGLDPVTSITGNPCGMPFRRLLVKTRASASFTAQLKDFVAPIAMFVAPKADLGTATPKICNQGALAEIHVTNPLSTSTYQWTTTGGHIITAPTGPSIFVDTPGTYIVSQYLVAGCSAYASDTITIAPSNACFVLPAMLANFHGSAHDNVYQLSWDILNNQQAKYFIVQHSNDGVKFTNAGEIQRIADFRSVASYSFHESVNAAGTRIYYRIIMVKEDNSISYSTTLSLSDDVHVKGKLTLYPNPARNNVQLQFLSAINGKIRVDIYDASARLVLTQTTLVQRGNNSLTLTDLANKPAGMYLVILNTGEEQLQQKLLLVP